MNTGPKTQDEWTIHALNIHGVFFERRCAAAIADTPGWKVLSTNYPVEFPPPNGPWRGKESSLDVWARSEKTSDNVVDALIECKKANPEFVNWVFFSRGETSSVLTVNCASIINDSNPSGTEAWTTAVRLRSIGMAHNIASDAREVRGNYLELKGINKTKTSSAAIQEAAYQVALASRAVAHEELSLIEKARSSPEHPLPPWAMRTYVPIIVTTAQLLRMEFSPRSTDLRSGEISFSAAKLTPVLSIVYEYALPKHLQYSPANPLEILKSGPIDTFSRMQIIVVHAEEFSNLLVELIGGAT